MIACDYYYSARMDSKKTTTLTTDTFCRGTLPSSPVCGSHSSDRGLRTSLPTSPARRPWIPLDHPFVAITMLFYMFYLIRSMYFYIFGW